MKNALNDMQFFTGLNLRISNLLNLLQRNERNSIMEHQNCTKIHADNFEYMFYKIMSQFWFLGYFLN